MPAELGGRNLSGSAAPAALAQLDRSAVKRPNNELQTEVERLRTAAYAAEQPGHKALDWTDTV